MLSNSDQKLINSLQQKKYREKNMLFVVEGDKLVSEFLAGHMKVRKVFALQDWLKKTDDSLLAAADQVFSINERELGKISTLASPNGSLALVEIKRDKPEPSYLQNELSIVLDNIQDPGNLGSIIRIAAWFGIRTIICSKNTVDIYNPKTIQSSMGAILHVSVYYTELAEFLPLILETNLPVYGSFLEGQSIYDIEKQDKGLIIFGNESKGISANLLPFINKKILIPPFKSSTYGIDSLNVAMSAAIICNEFRRDGKRHYSK